MCGAEHCAIPAPALRASGARIELLRASTAGEPRFKLEPPQAELMKTLKHIANRPVSCIVLGSLTGVVQNLKLCHISYRKIPLPKLFCRGCLRRVCGFCNHSFRENVNGNGRRRSMRWTIIMSCRRAERRYRCCWWVRLNVIRGGAVYPAEATPELWLGGLMALSRALQETEPPPWRAWRLHAAPFDFEEGVTEART